MESINWTQEQMLEVELKEPDDFLKIRETLSRIGVASRKEKVLYQSCHIARRNTIAKLLSDWGLVNVKGTTDVTAPLSQIKIISFKEKDDWTLETKYNIGKKREA